MGPGRIAMLLILAASHGYAQPTPGPLAAPVAAPGAPQEASGVPVKRIFVPPPLQWDNAMLSFRPALQQTPTDFANLTGGIGFGMSASAVNARLPDPYPGLNWNGLTLANEYPGEVRYFGEPVAASGPLRMALTACAGSGSYIVFLFSDRGLFRLSYRLIPDKGCPDTNPAAQEIFHRYVPIGQIVALSVRYRTGKTEVVDVTDSTAGYLIPPRWRQGIN
jgi:hypothetical protein